jgi:hypothetical protein
LRSVWNGRGEGGAFRRGGLLTLLFILFPVGTKPINQSDVHMNKTFPLR